MISTALLRVTSLLRVLTGWTAAIRFDLGKKLILITTKRIMATPDRDGNRFLRDVHDFIRRYYDEDKPERHLTRIRDHEYEPTRDQFNDIVRQTLLKIAHKYDYHYEITLPDGRLGMDLNAVLRDIDVSVETINATYEKLMNDLRHQYEEADEFIHSRISEALNKPHNRRPEELQIAKIITGNKQLNARDLALRLDHWLGTHTIQQWINIFRERWHDERARDERAERQRQRREERNRQRVRQERTVAYPFKSKATAYIKMNPDAVYEPLVSDAAYSKRELKMLKRPYYSKYPGCWEIDHAFNIAKEGDSWLFCVNVNTRYLVVYEAAETKTQVLRCLTDLISRFEVRSVRGDGSAAYSTSNVNDDATFTQRDLDRYDVSHRNADSHNIYRDHAV